jgi:hypothetical protein
MIWFGLLLSWTYAAPIPGVEVAIIHCGDIRPDVYKPVFRIRIKCWMFSLEGLKASSVTYTSFMEA